MKYLNVYAVTRHYGGPEEGGWWFNRGEPLASVPVTPDMSDDQIIAERDRLKGLFEDYAEGDIYSVLGGVAVSVHNEDHVARPWPKHTPHYE